MGGWQSCFISVNKNAKNNLANIQQSWHHAYSIMLTERYSWEPWMLLGYSISIFFLSFLPSFFLLFFFGLTIQWKSLVSYYDYLKGFSCDFFRVTRQVMFTEILNSSMVKSQLKEKSQHPQQCHPLVQKCFTLQRLKGSLSEERIPQAVQTLIGIVLSGSIPLSSQQSTKRTRKRLSWIVMSLWQ